MAYPWWQNMVSQAIYTAWEPTMSSSYIQKKFIYMNIKNTALILLDIEIKSATAMMNV